MRTGRGASRHGAARQPLAIEAVEGVAHRRRARRPSRRGWPPGLAKAAPGSSVQVKRVGADADPDAGRVERVDLGLGDEVARVDEAEAVDLAGVLGRGRATQRDERVVLVARGARGRCRPTAVRGAAAWSTTWFSRAHAPLSWTSSQRASGRSSVALITPVSRTAAAPSLRIRALRATTGRSRKIVYGRSTARPLTLVGERDLERVGLRRRPRRRSLGGRRPPRPGLAGARSGARRRRGRGRVEPSACSTVRAGIR